MFGRVVMKILIVSTYDVEGGAARAAYRLHRELLNNDIHSQMLVQNKSSDDYTVIGVKSTFQKAVVKLAYTVEKLPLLHYKNKSQTLFSPSFQPFGSIVDRINEIDPDIVHLHWICEGMIRIEDIPKIKAPVVWTHHDMWAFTGGCHYDEGCQGYEYICGNCKVLQSNKENDLSRKVFKRKQKAYDKKKDIVVVGLSKWIFDCSIKSTLLKDKKHINLPNPIDTEIFKPFSKEQARILWNLPKGKKIVLFGAMGATSDPRKGFKQLRDALRVLNDKSVELVVFGSSAPKERENFGFTTHYLGVLSDDVSLVTLYNAVDVMVVPSLQENLSNAIMESLACGTPVVAFDIGGNSDMIVHKWNGYLAKPFNSENIAIGIEWILSNSQSVSNNARQKILSEFKSSIIVKKYIELYGEILNG